MELRIWLRSLILFNLKYPKQSLHLLWAFSDMYRLIDLYANIEPFYHFLRCFVTSYSFIIKPPLNQNQRIMLTSNFNKLVSGRMLTNNTSHSLEWLIERKKRSWRWLLGPISKCWRGLHMVWYHGRSGRLRGPHLINLHCYMTWLREITPNIWHWFPWGVVRDVWRRVRLGVICIRTTRMTK